MVSLDGGAGLDRLREAGPRPNLVVLDGMLPGEDGLSICRRLREAGGPPVVMLTAKDEDIDRTIDVQVSRLPHKLDNAGSTASALIKTVSDAGYILAAPVKAAP